MNITLPPSSIHWGTGPDSICISSIESSCCRDKKQYDLQLATQLSEQRAVNASLSNAVQRLSDALAEKEHHMVDIQQTHEEKILDMNHSMVAMEQKCNAKIFSLQQIHEHHMVGIQKTHEERILDMNHSLVAMEQKYEEKIVSLQQIHEEKIIDMQEIHEIKMLEMLKKKLSEESSTPTASSCRRDMAYQREGKYEDITNEKSSNLWLISKSVTSYGRSIRDVLTQTKARAVPRRRSIPKFVSVENMEVDNLSGLTYRG